MTESNHPDHIQRRERSSLTARALVLSLCHLLAGQAFAQQTFGVAASPGMVNVVPPGAPPPGPPDTSLSQWPTATELESGKIDDFPGMRGTAFLSCSPARTRSVSMVFQGESAEVRIGLGKPLGQLVGSWAVLPVGSTGMSLAAVCDREDLQVRGATVHACREAFRGTVNVQRVSATEVLGTWDVTFRHPVFAGGMSIKGPFRATVLSGAEQPCD